MKKLIFMVLVAHMGSVACYGQLNNYKYIVVPTKFQDFKKENQYRTSSLVKYLFANEGFNAVYSTALPDDMKDNPCLGLKVELVDKSTLFTTKTQLSLIDCNGVLVLMSQEGRTKTKEFEQAYREAISEAFGSFRGLNHSYRPSKGTKTSESITLNFKNDVKSLEEETKPKAEAEDRFEEVEVPSRLNGEMGTSVSAELPMATEKGVLYAQPIDIGYQLVDTTPKVVYVLRSTSAPDVFMVNKDGKNGVVFKNEDKWFIEMDEKGGKAKELNIKF